MKRIIFALSLLSLSASVAMAQRQVRESIKEGNSHYNNKEYLESEIEYRKALEANANSTDAKYNLGNSLYRQQKAEDALKQYMSVAQSESEAGNKDLAADAFFNAGDIMMSTQDYAKAEELFKQALRMKPSDDQARYNMLLAKKLNQQQQQDQQNEDQQNKDQQNKDQQNKDQQKQDQDNKQNQDNKQDEQKQDEQKQDQQDQDNKQNQQQDQQNQQDQQQQQGQQQPKEGQMSQEQAEAILQASSQEEKDTQEKVKAKLMEQVKRKKTDKDW